MKKKNAIQELNKLAKIKPSIREDVWLLLLEEKFDQATEKIVEFIKGNEHIYTLRDDIKSEIYIYEDGIYVPKGRSHIKQICRDIFGRVYTDAKAKNVINKIEVDTYIEAENFFKEHNLEEVPVNNGILNLKTKQLSDFTPQKIFFNKLPVDYDVSATCPMIDKFLSDVLKHESDKDVFYEIAGFGLYREYFIERAVMCNGAGRNGKGKSLELLKRFVGAENTCSIHLSNMQYKTSALCELHNRLFNLGGDLNSTALKEVGMFKQLTGRDVVQVPRKYLRDLIFQNYEKHVFACNELPKVYDKSIGFWSRWIVLEYPYRFVPKAEYEKLSEEERKGCKILDPAIIEKISTPEELSGLLNKALNGLDRLLKNKDFTNSKGTKEVMDYWIRKSDSFMSFCLDELEEGREEGDFISKEDLRRAYQNYRKKHKLKKGESDFSIRRTLQDVFGCEEDRKNLYEERDNGVRIKVGEKRIWLGIKFKNKGVL